MLPPHSPLKNRITPQNKTRPFHQVAKPLTIPRPFQSRSKSRSRPTGEPVPGAGIRQVPLQQQTPLEKRSPRPVLRDVAGVQWPRSTSLASPRRGPISKGESPGRRRRTRGARPGHNHTGAHSHVQRAHTWPAAARRKGVWRSPLSRGPPPHISPQPGPFDRATPPAAHRAQPAPATRYWGAFPRGGRGAGPRLGGSRRPGRAGRWRGAHSPPQHRCRPPTPPSSRAARRGARLAARRQGTWDAARGRGSRGGPAPGGNAGPRLAQARAHTRARARAHQGPRRRPGRWGRGEGEEAGEVPRAGRSEVAAAAGVRTALPSRGCWLLQGAAAAG